MDGKIGKYQLIECKPEYGTVKLFEEEKKRFLGHRFSVALRQNIKLKRLAFISESQNAR